MSVGIVLIHGYTGSPQDLKQLEQQCVARYGSDSVINVCLPGHGADDIPLFDKESFMLCISKAIKTYQSENRTIIILGHSTGGILALAFLQERSFVPHLLILAAVPKKIDITCKDRWNAHVHEKKIPFHSVANMVSTINAIGAQQYRGNFPVLIVHGENDEMVPLIEASAWRKQTFHGPVRAVSISSAGHSLFQGARSGYVIDVVLRAISDIATPLNDEHEVVIDMLSSVECEVKKFLAVSPLSGRHLAECPSGKALKGNQPSVSHAVSNEPVFANIEITTQCNLNCRYCARSLWGKQSEDMSKALFHDLLDMLPHAYRITLVGLGEPLIHPDILDFVSEAASQGRRVALVTNGTRLDTSLSRELIRAGLQSITFSIDTLNQEVISDLKSGTDVGRVIENMKAFIEIASSMRPISIAVFSAVSKETVQHLHQLTDLISESGVNVWMLSDLNFAHNVDDSLWKNMNEGIATSVRETVAYAFSKKVPVLSVHGLEEFGMVSRYKEHLLFPPSQLYQRSDTHRWCFSPWQTVPIDVRGNMTVCDCQPEKIVGNLVEEPFSTIWEGELMKEHRTRMISPDPPENCKICPRF